MKRFLLLAFLWLSATMAGNAPAGEPFRTAINPALLYYQAFALAPEHSTDERNHLVSEEWRGRDYDALFERLIVGYNSQFKLARQAAKAQVPCDWGLDLSQGPETLLPGLAKAKAIAQTARLRARWQLRHGKPDDARDDLIAGYAIARNTSQGGVLIGALVQFAMESIILNGVAENLLQFTPETLTELVAGLEACPPRGTVQQCVTVEKASFFDWYIAKLTQFQQETPGNEEAILKKLQGLLERTVGDDASSSRDFAQQVISTSGGTSAGVLARLKELEPLYAELATLLGTPYGEFAAAKKAFEKKITEHSNPLVRNFLSAIPKSRDKEFMVQVRLAMVQAAVAYRVHGEDGFRKVIDPCGDGPFTMERLVVDNIDRGFLLTSKLNARGFNEKMAFATDVMPVLYGDGKNAGKPLQKDPNKN